MPRLRVAKVQPLHTLFMQHIRNDDCNGSSGKGSWQIGQSSSSDLARPFFISTTLIPLPRTPRIAGCFASAPAVPRSVCGRRVAGNEREGVLNLALLIGAECEWGGPSRFNSWPERTATIQALEEEASARQCHQEGRGPARSRFKLKELGHPARATEAATTGRGSGRPASGGRAPRRRVPESAGTGSSGGAAKREGARRPATASGCGRRRIPPAASEAAASDAQDVNCRRTPHVAAGAVAVASEAAASDAVGVSRRRIPPVAAGAVATDLRTIKCACKIA
ncbi:hypothetical protein THAOC_22481 [Thalassiosira oceanica]|uniref:Uncharacterized protein n=1 Tax=Thalassiosira oceanica TaxID=159749 RepID=K0S970_THAOC|nr:hypothetical protein THAOC_22481 [Thalassiosira oceanica]|eukprot:EJK57471.1 hypothetical protein THAOC_22481 [Thalassiosira oceanica]